MLPRARRAALDGAWRAAEARRGRGLHYAVELDEGVACLEVRVRGRFAHGEHRREAHFVAFHESAPLVARARLEHGREAFTHRRPLFAVLLRRQIVRTQAEQFERVAIEACLVRAQRNVFPIRRFVDVVVRCAGIEPIGAAFVAPQAAGTHAVHERHEGCATVDHRRVHHLTPAAGATFQQCADDAEREVERAAAEVAGQVQRRYGRPTW